MKKEGRKIVIFLCTGNAARSQIAEGLMRQKPALCSWGREREYTRDFPILLQ